jgi:hypothetical protein
MRIILRFILPAIIGGFVGFLALAFAIQNEPTVTPAVLAVVSPGLKVAEMLVPAKHESLGSTFGGFLRVATGVNTAFYFAVLALVAYLLDRRRSP